MKKIILLLVSLFFIHSVSSQSTLNEGFESWPPTDWQILELGAALDGWIPDWEGVVHTGTGSASSGIDNNQCDNWLISSAVNVVNVGYQLKFWEISASIEYYDKVSVLVSSGSNDPTSGDFVEVYESNTLNTVTWEERVIDLSSYNGQTIYVAFRYEGTWHKWYIDDVSISPALFSDAALTEFLSPIGVSETPVLSPITVKVENVGASIINDFNISWEVNSVAQPTYTASALNLLAGETAEIEIGTYNFISEGSYNIEAEINLVNDFENSNNLVQTVFEISSFKDGAIVGLTPEGMVPNQGNTDVIVELENLGDNTIDVAEILWTVDDVNQTSYTTTSLNLAPGETTSVTIGQYTFSSGVYNITATLHALGDINNVNNQYDSKAAIDTFWESFEGDVFPPEDWSINFGTRDGVNFDNPVDGEYYYVSTSSDNYFGVVSDTIYTPLLDIANGDHFRFYIKTNAFTPADHTLVWKDGVTGQVNLIQNIANSAGLNSWELRDIDISAATGTNYIGITNNSSAYGESKFDLFTSDAKLHLFDNDLKILNGDMYFLAKQNVSQGFECKIKNRGALPVLGTAYILKLMESPNIELASISGVDLDSWEETTLEINHTFTEISEKRLYFEIVFAVDENTSNNTFREANVSVVPNTIEISTIGSPDIRNGNIPFNPNGNTNTLGEDDMSQLLFYNNEFNSPGYVHGIAYKYDNLLEADKVIHYPLKVWIAQTSEPNLDGGWFPSEELTLVFDGVIEILPGFNRDLYIPFNEPILINGIENVMIKSYQYDPEWPPSIFRFLSTNVGTGPTRAIGTADYYELDPDDTSVGHFSSPEITYTKFIVNPSTSSSVLSGIVYNNDSSTPIENATISIEGSAITVQTDVNGNYTLPSLPYGSYNITASFNGFRDNTIAVELNAATQTQDFYLDLLNEVEVIGTIYGSNDISTPLELVDVTILQNGTIIESVTTDNNGDFIFPIVYGGSDYEVKVFMYGYYEQIIPISPVDTNINLGDIVLDQEFISPFDVVVNTDTEPTVNWKSPKESTKVKLQNDLNGNSYSYTNEANENVWLGNYFSISKLTTITSVDIQTDIYENAIDYVTIDIFDAITNEILASSEPFLIQKDSLQTIDTPNIVVNNTTIAAMVHWQNNPVSTNALAVDFSDPNILNSAVIKFPDQPIGLLTDLLGEDAPNMSFLVRVNILDDGTPITNTETISYNVYRGLASEFPDISNWILLNDSPVTDVSLIDSNSTDIDLNQNYRYAIETIYSNGFSEVTFSNIISGQVLDIDDYQLFDSEILLFPNPARDKITIKFGANLQISSAMKVFDILGKQVLTIHPSEIQDGYVTKEVNSLENGLYFLKININGIVVNKKFIVN